MTLNYPKRFKYEGEEYQVIVPAKTLFHSTTIWEVITRGDVFAVNLKTKVFTVFTIEQIWKACDPE